MSLAQIHSILKQKVAVAVAVQDTQLGNGGGDGAQNGQQWDGGGGGGNGGCGSNSGGGGNLGQAGTERGWHRWSEAGVGIDAVVI